jgi:hypothetical protein
MTTTVKNLTAVPLTFPNGAIAGPGKTIGFADADWQLMVNDDMVKGYITSGSIEVNGTVPAGPPGTAVNAIYKLTQAEYNTLSPPNASTLYIIVG